MDFVGTWTQFWRSGGSSIGQISDPDEEEKSPVFGGRSSQVLGIVVL